MNITIVYILERPRDQVAIHAWDQDGMVWSQKGERALDGRLFRFLLAGQTTDQREVSFKYHFLTEDDRWESDEYVRTIPTRTATSLWTFDYTARCLVQDPDPTAAFPTVTIHVIIQRRYRGGQLFLWSPDGTQQPPTARCSETQRDDTAATSTFVVSLSDWMRDGFHFKLLGSANNFGDFEPERANRVWRPSDGANMWIKSGQVDVRSQPLALVSTSVNFLHPQSMAAPQLHIQDLVDDFEAILDPPSTIATDAQFLRSQFQISIYPNAIYELRWTSEPLSTVRRFQVPLDGPPEPSFAVNGYDRWLVQLPTEQTTQGKIVIHPNPASTFGATAQLQVGIGYAEAHQQLSATKQLDNTWEVQFSTLVNVPYWLEVLGETRSDGSFSSGRLFTAADNETTTLHTIDGVSGLNRAWQNPFQDVPPPLRRRLMEATYSPAIVAAGVFDPWEMPHGVTALGSDIYFVLRAPHTVQSTLLLMPLPNAPGTPRTMTQVALSLTHDLR